MCNSWVHLACTPWRSMAEAAAGEEYLCPHCAGESSNASAAAAAAAAAAAFVKPPGGMQMQRETIADRLASGRLQVSDMALQRAVMSSGIGLGEMQRMVAARGMQRLVERQRTGGDFQAYHVLRQVAVAALCRISTEDERDRARTALARARECYDSIITSQRARRLQLPGPEADVWEAEAREAGHDLARWEQQAEEAGLAAAPLSRSEGGMLYAELLRRRPEVGSKVSPACGRNDPRPSLSPIAPPQLSQVVVGNYLDRDGWDLDGLRSDLAKLSAPLPASSMAPMSTSKGLQGRAEAAEEKGRRLAEDMQAMLAADTRSYEELLAYYTALPWLGASARETHARAYFEAARAARRQRGELQPSPCWKVTALDGAARSGSRAARASPVESAAESVLRDLLGLDRLVQRGQTTCQITGEAEVRPEQLVGGGGDAVEQSNARGAEEATSINLTSTTSTDLNSTSPDLNHPPHAETLAAGVQEPCHAGQLLGLSCCVEPTPSRRVCAPCSEKYAQGLQVPAARCRILTRPCGAFKDVGTLYADWSIPRAQLRAELGPESGSGSGRVHGGGSAKATSADVGDQQVEAQPPPAFASQDNASGEVRAEEGDQLLAGAELSIDGVLALRLEWSKNVLLLFRSEASAQLAERMLPSDLLRRPNGDVTLLPCAGCAKSFCVRENFPRTSGGGGPSRSQTIGRPWSGQTVGDTCKMHMSWAKQKQRVGLSPAAAAPDAAAAPSPAASPAALKTKEPSTEQPTKEAKEAKEQLLQQLFDADPSNPLAAPTQAAEASSPDGGTALAGGAKRGSRDNVRRDK